MESAAKKHKAYTDEEDAIILKMIAENRSNPEILQALPGRTYQSMATRKKILRKRGSNPPPAKEKPPTQKPAKERGTNPPPKAEAKKAPAPTPTNPEPKIQPKEAKQPDIDPTQTIPAELYITVYLRGFDAGFQRGYEKGREVEKSHV